jgi:hypothetical protein
VAKIVLKGMKWLTVCAGMAFSVAGAVTPAELATALDFDGGSVTADNWEISSALTHDGVDALRAVPNPAGVTDPHTLRLAVTGPGTLKFWAHVPLANSNEWATMEISSDVGFSRSRWGLGESGWEQETVWVPAGGHWVEIRAAGDDDKLPGMVVDQVSFVASTVIPLAEGMGQAGPVWENDAALQWMGVSREGEKVAISPVLSSGETSRVTTEVTGPGIVSFEWKSGGGGR